MNREIIGSKEQKLLVPKEQKGNKKATTNILHL